MAKRIKLFRDVKFQIRYLNHRGELHYYYINPKDMFFGTTEYYPQPQMLLKANVFVKDGTYVEGGQERTFALANILDMTEPRTERKMPCLTKHS